MRIFTRYILREVASYALLGGVLFTFVLFMRYLPQILGLLVRDSASFADAVRIFGDLLPNTLIFTIPTAVLAGILLGLSRLAADSEVTAMRASGMGALTFIRIVSILAFTALGAGLVNALYFAPRGATDLLNLENQLKTSQASVTVEPRVFYEDFKNYVLYVQDVHPSANAVWHNVFLADLTQPANPDIITAEQAVVGSGAGSQGLILHLINAGEHRSSPVNPNQYDIYSSSSIDLPLQLESHDPTPISRRNAHLQALSMHDLWLRSRGIAIGDSALSVLDIRAAKIELNSRFSYPFACLVLMLIGVPLGLSSKRGGKSTGFILTLLLVFGYYMLSEVGIGFAKSGKLSPYVGVWAANYIFTAFGIVLLQQLSGGGVLLNSFTGFGAWLGKHLSAFAPGRAGAALLKFARSTDTLGDSSAAALNPNTVQQPLPPHQPTTTLVQRLRRLFGTSFPLLLDGYVMRSYATNFVLSLGTFALLYVVFTFFELMGDITRNQTPFIIVGEYLLNLIPFIVNAVTPLCSLLAVLITFGALNRSSELTAMKATGISLYRVVAPILVLAAVVAIALFAFDESYLPEANRRQEQLRAQIKDKPAQTFLLPGRQFISGKSGNAGEPARIFYYVGFDQDRQVFADLNVFEFDPKTFTLERRIYAKTARWDSTVSSWIFENGWQRSFSGEAVSSYTPFTVSTFPEIREQPGYFTKEDKPSDEMSYGDLNKYIADLSQSGFDTVKLRVQLANKLSVPAITLVMAVIAVPFALSMGKRGGLAGIATAIGVAISYSVVAGIFTSMGDINTLPPQLAAWSPDLLFGFAGSYLLLRTPT